MASANVSPNHALLQPAHLPPAGRSLTHGQHRRGALLSLAGIAAGATAATAQAADTDPVLALAARHAALQRQGDVLAGVRDEMGASAAWDASWDAADACIATPPLGLAGLAAQLHVLAARLDIIHGNHEDAAATRTLAAHAEALAGRAVA